MTTSLPNYRKLAFDAYAPICVHCGFGIREVLEVAHLDGNRAMLLIRPALADFSFPAGRYALLVKSVAYDFSVDGIAADMARCVERTGRTNPSAAGAPCPN